MSEIILSIRNISKNYDDNQVLQNISLDIHKGELLTLLGSSGCGKTTLLRIIAGFEQISAGDVFLNGENITAFPPEKRKVNTVFQNYALFPHMNVFDNIAYGLKIKKVEKKTLTSEVNYFLKLVQMNGFEKRMPNQLSGGERQRVAIARALINRPEILLLDEPLGALDMKLRQSMQTELKNLQKSTGITFIYVTHDQEEALYLSDRIALMHNSEVCQIGTPEEIYRLPKTQYAAKFIGERNFLKVVPIEKCGIYSLVSYDDYTFEALGRFRSGETLLTVLYDAVKIHKENPKDSFGIQAVIKDVSLVGSQTRVNCDANGKIIKSTVYNSGETYLPGDIVYLNFDKQNAVLIKDDFQNDDV